ncbi:histone deacetylase family protein [Aestuariivirga sp.]|jgi:acetoin utilization deacetylase AcuC-like enzyme|uniref:histone deacetylase family protein n=1 Tax=Aestuariivirga sp. TaxID=2650926 RepID=UPI0037833800
MKIVYGDGHRGHAGAEELMYNRMVPMFEKPERMDQILRQLGRTGLTEIHVPTVHDLAAVHRVHDRRYVRFLETVYPRWVAETGIEGFATAYVFGMRGMRQTPGDSVQAMLSCYTFDVCVPFVAGTWTAIKEAVDVTLTAQALVAAGAHSAFALCRPPGHHASQDLAGGYCYINNAAVAAQAFRDHGAARVAILDVDYHHGNGTQRIFYERPDVLYVSIHGRPEEEYPFLMGFADETGAGAGEGFNVNLPLPKGIGWGPYGEALALGVARINAYRPDVLLVSLGADAYKDDPVSAFRLESSDFGRIGKAIAGLRMPTLFVMEGGYAVEALGINIANALTGFLEA